MPDIDWTKAEEVAARLISLHHLNVKPVTVTIGRTTYVGARYNPMDAPESQRIYLLGERPPSSNRAVYRLPGDDGDWYLASYMEQERINAETRAFHPHGPWFLLDRWPHEKFDERIDAHDERQVRRMEITIEEPQHV